MKWNDVQYKIKKDTVMTRRFKRFFQHLDWCTNLGFSGMKQIMYGANVQVNDDGRFYNMMCHDILTCERKRNNGTDANCRMCRTIYKAYYEKASYGNGSSHYSWRDDDFPQYRLGKEGRKAVLPNLVSTRYEVSEDFDFIIGLRKIRGKLYTWFQFEAAMGEDDLTNYNALKDLDSESQYRKTWKMATAGHVGSTLRYGWSRLNQGPFGETYRNDGYPLKLKLEWCRAGSKFFSPIQEEDSVNYQGGTDCFNSKVNSMQLKF